jgi:hypothetical protein
MQRYHTKDSNTLTNWINNKMYIIDPYIKQLRKAQRTNESVP